MVDLGPVAQELLFLPLGQAAGDNDAARAAAALQLQHLVDGGKRLGPRPLDEAAGVDDDEVGSVRLADQLVAVEFEEAEHSLAIDKVFRAAKTDEGIRAFTFSRRSLSGRASRFHDAGSGACKRAILPPGWTLDEAIAVLAAGRLPLRQQCQQGPDLDRLDEVMIEAGFGGSQAI